jgi:hypothetical protein
MKLARAIVAGAALATCCTAIAEPRMPKLDADLEKWLARGDYVYVWELDRGTLGRGDAYRAMRTYYEGLMYALTEARRFIEPGTPALLRLDPMPVPAGWHEAYEGTLKSRETYLEGDAVTLHAEIVRRDCSPARSQVFYLVSLKPRDDPGWDELREARNGIRCGP